MNEENTPEVSHETAGSPQPAASFQAYDKAEVMNEESPSSVTPESTFPYGTPGQAFMRALQAMEKDRNVEHLLKHFSSRCKLWRQSYAQPYEATKGAKHFWDQYLNQFESIETNFTHVIERDDLSILEWESQGVLQGGRPIHYRGVSILEFGDESKVQTFRTYFDSAHFISAHGQASNH